MNSLQKIKLKDISKNGRGYYGIGASAVPFSSDKYTYLRITDINDDGTLNKTDLKSVDADGAEDYLLSPNDIVFARTGNSTGRNYFYDGRDGQFVYAGFLIKFSIDESKINPKYVKYYLQSKQYEDWVASFNTGSTRGNINAKTYAELEIPLLSTKLQNLIADVLGSLDDKIELNNKINANLEEQAQALFKRWFVDFEFPDQNGNPYKSSGGELIDSELGQIPLGWTVGTLSDIVTVKYGKDHKKLEDGSIPVYGSGGVMRYADKSLYESESVLIPRKGTLGNIIYINEPFWSVDTMFYTEMKMDNIAKFVYFFMQSQDLVAMNAGSAVPSMTTEILNKLVVVIPQVEKLRLFEDIANPIFKTMQNNILQNKNIAEIRNTLLPKLMNNQIK